MSYDQVGWRLFGQPPTPPPYNQYTVRGVLQRPAGGSKENFAVILPGKFQYSSDSGFVQFRRVAYTWFGDIPVGLTDTAGAFFIRVSSSTRADSLRLAVVVPARPLTLGVPFSTAGAQAVPTTETYTPEPEPGCSACSTAPGKQEHIVFYSYYFDGKAIAIPF